MFEMWKNLRLGWYERYQGQISIYLHATTVPSRKDVAS